MDYKHKIIFETQKAGEGDKQTAAGLREVKEEAKTTATEIKKLATAEKEVAAQTEQATQATQESKPAHEEAGEAAKKHALRHEEFARAARAVAGDIPHLASIIHAFRSPLVAASLAIGVLVEAYRRWIGKLDEMEKANAVHDHVTKSLGAMQSALSMAKTEEASFNEELAETAKTAPNVVEQLDKITEAIHRKAIAEAEVTDADKALKLEKIRQDEKAGKLTPEQAIRARATVETEAVEARRQREIRVEEEKQEAREEGLRKAMEQRVRDEMALPGALKQAAEDKRNARAAQGKLDSDKASIKERREKAEKAKQDYKDRLARSGFTIPFAGIEGEDNLRAMTQEDLDAVEKELALLDRQDEFAQESFDKAQKKAGQSDQRAKDLKGRISAGRDAEGKLFEDVSQGATDLDQKRRHKEKVGGLEDNTRNLRTETYADEARCQQDERQQREFEQQQREEERFRKHGGVGSFGGGGRSFGGPGNSQVTYAANELVGAVNENGEVILGALETVRRVLQSQRQKIEIVEARLNKEIASDR